MKMFLPIIRSRKNARKPIYKSIISRSTDSRRKFSRYHAGGGGNFVWKSLYKYALRAGYWRFWAIVPRLSAFRN
jgi:hypothetical protein